MNGFKTLITNVVSLGAMWLASRGLELTPEQQVVLVEWAFTGLVGLNLWMRNISTGKAGWRK